MVALSSFVGREVELGELGEAVAAHRLVTVTGPGGVGKTRLVRELERGLQAAGEPAVRWCRPPRAADADDALADIVTQLGLASVDAALFVLRDQPTLLVLDECEHDVVVAARVAATLLSAVDSLTIVATSRIPLGLDGECLVVLRPLALPLSDDPIELEASAAVRLFRDRAAAVGMHVGSAPMQLAEVGRVVRDLDGLPLAIELAAARVRALGLGDLLKLLERRLDLLRRPEGASSPPQPSMRAVLDTSFELLDEPDRRLLRWLSVYPGPVALDMVHLVCGAEGADEVDTLDGLGRLVACSLLVAERDDHRLTRYRMYETVRAYAAERRDAAGEQETVQQRYVDALAGMADSFVAQAAQRWSAALVERMLGCFDNLAGAVEVCLAGDADGSRAFRLFLPLYAAVHGDRPADVAALGHRMLARWPHGDEPFRAEAIAVTAVGALLAGRDREALEMAERSVADPGASPLVAVLADRVRGFAAHYRGDRAAAIAHLESARRHAASWSGPLARELTVALSSVRGAGPEAERALSELARVAAEAEALDEHATEIWARVAAGHLLVRLDRIEESRREAAAAQRLAERLAHPWGLASSLRLLAVLEGLERGWDSARPAWRATLAQVAESGDLEAAALTIRVAASAALRSGRHDVAVALFEPLPRRSGRTVLPPVLDAEASELERVAVPAPASTIADAVQRARAILHEADRDAGRSALAPDRRHLGAPPRAAPDDAHLVRLGDTWSVTWAGTTASVRDVKGIRAVGRLLAQPNKELHCVELMDGAQHDGDTGPVVDREARRSYEARIRELQADVDEATAHSDLARMERAEAELDALVEHLTSALGLGGRARTTGQVAERARSAARWRLQSAIKRITEVHPDLGRHLRNSITTGIWCAYRPEQPVRWHVDETIAPATDRSSNRDSGRPT